jgi:eukaryotic-like serine/threonine-protein kinase
MDPDRWQKITVIFHQALAQDAQSREAFLAAACGADAGLRRDVDGMLAGDAKAEHNPEPFRPVSASITPGTHLGPYRIESLIGAGGMGEVYRARDTRLNRTVAIKVLPPLFSSGPELRERFEREAHAIAALHHPNICMLHDIGDVPDSSGLPTAPPVRFLVMEYLEGNTLEACLKKGAMPLDRVLQHAIEIADALASAHRAGITHRDLKPANVILTRDGAKLLDFGLAKFRATIALGRPTGGPTTQPPLTAEGMLVGTVQYMAPEQLEGKEADGRADLFAFGALLYEMATGRKAFLGDSRTGLIAAILRDDPPAMTTIQPALPRALDRVVRICLAKDPDSRFQSAHDLAAQVRWIRDGGAESIVAAGVSRPRRRLAAWFGAATIALAAAAGATYVAVRPADTPKASFRQLTFRRGYIDAARFTPDGQTIVYTAAWDGKPLQIFSMRVDNAESQPLPGPSGKLLAISRSGELAILTKLAGEIGTLARVPLGGVGVHEEIDHVIDADWSPDGKDLAVLRKNPTGPYRLEYPAGTMVHEWSVAPVAYPRISPDGALVAVVEGDNRGGGWVTLVDRSGHAKRVTRDWHAVASGVVWSPSGAEVWFSASETGLNFGIHGVTRDGRERVVHEGPGNEGIESVAADGRAVLLHYNRRGGMPGLAPGDAHERDLSYLDFSRPFSLSADGKTLAFTESGAGAGPFPTGFVRGTDGSSAIRLGEGVASALSPDGTSVLVVADGRSSLKVVPVGIGQPRRLETGNLVSINILTAWSPDGTFIVFTANEPGRPRRIFVEPATGGGPRPVTAEGVTAVGGTIVVSPDSRYVLGRDSQSKTWRFPIGGGAPLPINGLAQGDAPLRWSGDGRSIWLLGRDRFPARVFQLDVATGQRSLWREIADADPAGLDPDWLRVLISADGKSYVYGYMRTLSDLYLAEGLK